MRCRVTDPFHLLRLDNLIKKSEDPGKSGHGMPDVLLLVSEEVSGGENTV